MPEVPVVIETERLALEPWSDAATHHLAQLAATPAVVRYIGDGLPWTDAKVHDVSAQNSEHWRRHGFGWRLARLRESGHVVGFIGLNFAGEGSGVDPEEYEIGWWLAPSAWGRGLAREGAATVRDEAFRRLQAPSILARIQPANGASLAVARAIGLQAAFQTIGRTGEAVSVLRLEAERWRPPSGD